MIRVVTLPATERMRGALGSTAGKAGGSGLPVMPEGWAVFKESSPPAPVPQLLPFALLFAPMLTTSFKVQGVKLPPANIIKPQKLYKVWDLKHLNNALGDYRWHDLMDHTQCLF